VHVLVGNNLMALRSSVLLALSLASASAHAGRPMVTDDAGVLEAKACHLETWVQESRDSTEYWAVPACNFTGNLELALGGAHIADPQDRQSLAVLQGKTLFKPLETNGWGVGLVFGNRFNPDRSLSGDVYAFVPISFSFRDDRWRLHANLGWLRERENSRHRMTWGVGSEAQLGQRTWLTVETFGQDQGKPFYQVGLRRWILPDRVQIDATYGSRIGHRSEEHWISVGVKFVSVPFLP